MSTPRVRVPAAARAGEIVEIRTLIDHPMETGLRRDEGGRLVPRNMLRSFEARANDEPVFAASFANGTAANPALGFPLRVERSLALSFVWQHEDGTTFRAQAAIRVS